VDDQTDFDKALEFTLEFEGGFCDYSEDRGGATKFGISKNAYPHIDIESLTLEKAKYIYKQDYWDKQKLSSIPFPLNTLIFDFSVNSGTRVAAKALQRILNIEEDGVIGPQTVAAALRALDFNINYLPVLCYRYLLERNGFIINLLYNNKTYYERFGRGLLNRLRHCYLWLSKNVEA